MRERPFNLDEVFNSVKYKQNSDKITEENLRTDQIDRCLGWKLRKRSFAWNNKEKETERLRILNKIGRFDVEGSGSKSINLLNWYTDETTPPVNKAQAKNSSGFILIDENSHQSPSHVNLVKPDPKLVKSFKPSAKPIVRPKGLSDISNTCQLSSPGSHSDPAESLESYNPHKRLFWGVLECYEDFVGNSREDDLL